MDLNTLLFGVYPYVALTVFLLGSWIRFDHEQYTWKSDSSQLLSKKGLRLASNLFHVGIIGLFFGHAAGLLIPHSVFLALGVSDLTHQWIAISAGTVFGTLTLLGAALLWVRRMFTPRVRAASRRVDLHILGWLALTAFIGLSTIPASIHHANAGDASTMIRLADWVQSIVYLQPKPALLRDVDLVYKLHVFVGVSVFLFFPFTRLVHIWSAPFGYLGRAYQIVRSKRGLVRG
ncbi:nitrate reductase, gamma subunit [Thiobacillus denitrificans ATCC 25259]|uniref:nitrate reductase (quinone) n=1 Tax=Thiobacillus denitrificans (strain ATCC 25259 / T1) TaxID=292415 RepID=Q3SJ11_THIDA|nr:respiratory nitrate reductase subunit gamma [Thiobacillus denitrificans]AAZ97359.1 nitrate reductase, gamma subunit [Thiobacillus denitrificans ATCC 25259]